VLVSEGRFANVIVQIEWVVNYDLCVVQRVKSVFDLHRWVDVQARVGSAWMTACNCKLFNVELSVVLQEFKQDVANVDLVQLCRHLFSLQETDDEEEESITGETACVRIIEAPHFQHLLQHQDKRLNNRIFAEVVLDQVNTL